MLLIATDFYSGFDTIKGLNEQIKHIEIDISSCFFYKFIIEKCKVSLTWDCYSSIIYVKLTLQKLRGSIDMKNRLEELRKEKGVNQEQLADILEVSRQTISSLEKGRYNPSIILAFKIARYFELSIEDIFIYEED